MELLKKNIDLQTFILIDKIEDTLIIDNLKKDVYACTDYFPTYTNVIAKHTQFDYLKGNIHFHNFLKTIKKQIYTVFQENFIVHEVWGNIYNNNDYAKLHSHVGSTAFSGILYLTDGPGPGTYFPQYDLTVAEEAGKFVLFHGHLLHEVKKFNYTKDRVTIAFNFICESHVNLDKTKLKITYISNKIC